jgi:hypothetical protein
MNGCAGVVKLVDAEDSKSSGPRARAGSIPASGTRIGKGFSDFAGAFFYGKIGECACFCNHLNFKVDCLSLCWKK